MKYLVKTLALATAIATFSSPVMAADDDIDILLAPERTFVEVGSGWYLRGDITASVNGSRIISGSYNTVTSEQEQLSFRDMIGFGVGAGYRFTNNLRADLNLGHYLSGELERAAVSLNKAVDCPGLRLNPASGAWSPVTIDNCSTYERAEYNTFALVGTGYYDLNPIGKFEPYVGAGLGIARVRWSEVTNGVICAPVSADVVGETCLGSGGVVPGVNEVYKHGEETNGTDYRMAYSVTAGFGYRIKQNMLLDLSYKFLGVGNTMGIAGGSSKASGTAKNGFGLHQINFGIRYEIW